MLLLKKRQFNKILKDCSNTKTKILEEERLKNLPDETKEQLITFLVKHRMPVLEILLNPLTNMGHLHACAYFHKVQGNKFIFLCTEENKPVIINSNG